MALFEGRRERDQDRWGSRNKNRNGNGGPSSSTARVRRDVIVGGGGPSSSSTIRVIRDVNVGGGGPSCSTASVIRDVIVGGGLGDDNNYSTSTRITGRRRGSGNLLRQRGSQNNVISASGNDSAVQLGAGVADNSTRRRRSTLRGEGINSVQSSPLRSAVLVRHTSINSVAAARVELEREEDEGRRSSSLRRRTLNRNSAAAAPVVVEHVGGGRRSSPSRRRRQNPNDEEEEENRNSTGRIVVSGISSFHRNIRPTPRVMTLPLVNEEEEDEEFVPSHPASRTAIRKLRRIKISENDIHVNNECPICIEVFQSGEKARQIECNHVYHKRCIIQWLKMRSTCPVCRFRLHPN